MSARRATGSTRPVTVLIVGAPDRAATAWWANMIAGEGLRVVLVRSEPGEASSELSRVRPVRTADDARRLRSGEVGLFEDGGGSAGVARALDVVAPDIVHALDAAASGSAALAAKRDGGAGSAKWLLSNGGGDLHVSSRLGARRQMLVEMLRAADGYIPETEDEMLSVRELGFAGTMFEPLPAAGGLDFAEVLPLRAMAKPSRRRTVLIDGAHDGRSLGLHVMSAVHLAAPALRGLELRIVSPSAPVAAAAAAIAADTGLEFALDERTRFGSGALDALADARLVVGCGFTDGLGATLLESMSMGAFPVLGAVSDLGDWLRDGVDGFVCSPHEVAALARGLERAAVDGALVDAAAERNRALVEARWSAARNGEIARGCYRRLLGLAPAQRPARADELMERAG